ncbi:hypothetical protein B0H16DRAFT_1465482 [Mycena metata]|uniref:Uncharacterized protein n=1 Tax=Mycena metata TaxID=1033252 RepID=A0AAD7IAR7_9AGAR|nr:hypothetical protein B0H16DRAFT_1465482 [Mycena metata]
MVPFFLDADSDSDLDPDTTPPMFKSNFVKSWVGVGSLRCGLPSIQYLSVRSKRYRPRSKPGGTPLSSTFDVSPKLTGFKGIQIQYAGIPHLPEPLYLIQAHVDPPFLSHWIIADHGRVFVNLTVHKFQVGDFSGVVRRTSSCPLQTAWIFWTSDQAWLIPQFRDSESQNVLIFAGSQRWMGAGPSADDRRTKFGVNGNKPSGFHRAVESNPQGILSGSIGDPILDSRLVEETLIRQITLL